MEITLHFHRLPDLPTLHAALRSIQPPFAVEIQQDDRYHELIDCETVADLFDFLRSEEYGVSPHEPFTIEVEEVEPEPDDSWNDHPSLTAAERQ